RAGACRVALRSPALSRKLPHRTKTSAAVWGRGAGMLAGGAAAAGERGGNMLSGSDEPAIIAEGASKLFLDGTVVAFHQLSLAVKRNEIMCVVGPSGCGKTTLLRSIGGLTDLSSGRLLVHGAAVAGRPPDGVAMVFQHFGL